VLPTLPTKKKVYKKKYWPEVSGKTRGGTRIQFSILRGNTSGWKIPKTELQKLCGGGVTQTAVHHRSINGEKKREENQPPGQACQESLMWKFLVEKRSMFEAISGGTEKQMRRPALWLETSRGGTIKMDKLLRRVSWGAEGQASRKMGDM